MKKITVYTDGSCLGNPGSGGYSAILRMQDHTKELSGGYCLTTNNRMEIMGAIVALEALKEPCVIELHTDSKYLHDAVEKKWIQNWKKNGWKTANKKAVKNQDLWVRLDGQLARHTINFAWVKAHAGNADNERCDELAKSEAMKKNLPADEGYLAE